MKIPARILTVTAAILLVAPATPQDKANPPPKEQIEESTKKIKELRKERIAVLKNLVDQTSKHYQTGRIPFDEVLETRLLLLEAELDAAEKNSDRIALYKNIVDDLKGYEKLAEARVLAARGTVTAVLKIKARRLEAEIHLEQAKAKK